MDLNRKVTQPIPVARTNRLQETKALTSLPAGKMVPIAAIPLLREDSIRSGRYRLSFEMMETAEILMNAISVRVMAYLVPTLAFDRFEGSMDALNKSYAGEPSFEGGTVIDYVQTHAMAAYGTSPFYKYLGLHAKEGTAVNDMYREAYNQIWNYRASNRSRDLELRQVDDETLAPAFWTHERFKHIVPDFDQAVIDGEVALNMTGSGMTLSGAVPITGTLTGGFMREEEEATLQYAASASDAAITGNTPTGPGGLMGGDALTVAITHELAADISAVTAEMAENGITVSLSNIEMARKTQAFARLREQYEGLDEEWVIDMLMNGLSIPDQSLKQPMLLADRSTIFGMSKRYATDSGNLNESVVNGATFIDLALRLPRLATGGVVMIVAEITPEQLFERQKDPFLHATSVDEFPEYLRDTLDPEKVSVVSNDYVDIDHDTPDDTFGYAPLNYEWNIQKPTIGGRFYRPEVDASFDEDRQRIWAVETQNPTLAEDFYLCTTMHTKPFVVTDQDPFEVVAVGQSVINGNTVFGGALVEASDNFDTVLSKAPTARIEKDA